MVLPFSINADEPDRGLVTVGRLSMDNERRSAPGVLGVGGRKSGQPKRVTGQR
jgi:hypothetical protein